MNSKKLAKRAAQLAAPYRIVDGDGFRLADFDPADTSPLGDVSKDRAREALAEGVRTVAELQEKLYAQDRWSVLVIFQAMDAAGKDSTIKHVMSGINPQGCDVHAFKEPSPDELDHDFLWRCMKVLPARGKIGIFNRSYYEELLVVRVHEEILQSQKLPPSLITKRIWEERFEDIVAFERHLARNGMLILKFFLNVSKKEQKKRFLERLEKPEKNWKFSVGDVRERALWNEYQRAFEDAIRHTAKKHAPWYVVPADPKWFTHIVVASAIIDGLTALDLEFPVLRKKERKELALAKELLERRGS
jgi:PPK2 family polyphosphate:nucleotide phosphotransferase